jgi:translation initiation factor IF-3
VRLIDDENEQRGVVTLEEAKALAAERGLDLVEVAPTAVPPVCRLIDYGRFRFEMAKREKDARRKQKVAEIKEMKLRPKIGDHDFQTKYRSVQEFLEGGSKVKVTIMFRGREMAHPDIGRALLNRVAEQATAIAAVERPPILEGRNMVMVLAPLARGATAGATA